MEGAHTAERARWKTGSGVCLHLCCRALPHTDRLLKKDNQESMGKTGNSGAGVAQISTIGKWQR